MSTHSEPNQEHICTPPLCTPTRCWLTRQHGLRAAAITRVRGGRLQNPARFGALFGAFLVMVIGALGFNAWQAQAGASVVDFRQCANNDPSNTGVNLGDCHWISSILQGGNASYAEGMSVPQRTVFTGIETTDDGIHTLTFDHDATKGGTHAYDWLVSYAQAEADAAAVGIPFNDLDGQACDDEIGPPQDLDETCVDLRASAFFIDVAVPDDPFLSQHGSTQTRINAYEALRGNRTIRIYANAAITGGALSLSHSVGNLGDTGDSQIGYVLTWDSDATAVLIEMAGHLAIGGDGTGMTWGAGNGSSDISGGPYHFNLRQLDGDALGAQDNQIMGASIIIPPGQIIVDKVTDPSGDAQSFTFTTTGTGYAGFSLTDAAAPNNSGPLDPGAYSVAETVPAGWDLTSSTCVSSLGDAETPASIDLDSGETVTCTFTNVKDAKIIINKVCDPVADPASFDFDVSWTADVDLLCGGSHDSGDLDPGTYTAAENVPAGWDLTSATCDQGETVGSIDVAAGETVTCTFTNVKRGKVELTKTFNGGAIPAGESFTFQLREDASTLSDGTVLATLVVDSTTVFPAQLNGLLQPGTYQVCEFILPGYDSTIRDDASAFVPNSLSDPDTVDNAYVCMNVTVTAGGTTTVNIDNTPPPGGMAKTIGFWKNWSSCTGGNQDHILDQTLASAGGFTLGTLLVDTCEEAFEILNKSTLNGKKLASNAAYNMAAQYLAYLLNVEAGAGSCAAADLAADAAEQLLIDYGFDGNKTQKPNKTDSALMNAAAATLDSYNNNTLCP